MVEKPSGGTIRYTWDCGDNIWKAEKTTETRTRCLYTDSDMGSATQRTFDVSVEAFETKTGTVVTLGKATKNIRVGTTATGATEQKRVTISPQPSAAKTGEEVTLTAAVEGVDEATKPKLTYEWTCQEGTVIGFGKEIKCVFTKEGSKKVEVKVKYESSEIGSNYINIPITIAPIPTLTVTLDEGKTTVRAVSTDKIRARVTPNKLPSTLTTYRYEWFCKEDASRTTISSTTPDATTSSSQNYYDCTYIDTDAGTKKIHVRIKEQPAIIGISDAVTVTKNKKPTIDSVTVTPSSNVYKDTSLKCTASGVSDPDGSSDLGSGHLSYKWLSPCESTTALATTETLTPSALNPGAVLCCEVTATDIYGAVTPKKSGPITIDNKPADISYTPLSVKEDTRFPITVTVKDIDNQIQKIIIQANLCKNTWTGFGWSSDDEIVNKNIECPSNDPYGYCTCKNSYECTATIPDKENDYHCSRTALVIAHFKDGSTQDKNFNLVVTP